MNITPHFSSVGKSSSWQMAHRLTAKESKGLVLRQSENPDNYKSKAGSNKTPRDFFTLSKQLRAMALGGP